MVHGKGGDTGRKLAPLRCITLKANRDTEMPVVVFTLGKGSRYRRRYGSVLA